METEDQRDKIIEQLEALNKKLDTQNSVRHIFLTGVIYGVGLFVGSVIIATIAFGIFGPLIGEIDWVKESYERGASLQVKDI